ncbi:hypothetical protein BC628DRAFT_356238 [Trametes gibbosa]|nr:hypothetical protein BC628DRAFT_356238 [Trametes gibbosa]
MHAFITLVTLAAALHATAKPAPAAPQPMITSPPAPIDAVRLKARDDVSTIPLASCTLNVACCEQVLTVPIIPASFTSLLPSSLTLPIAIPTLGPVVGVQCTPATSHDITGSSCLAGGSPVCCQEEIRCQPVVNIPSPTLPSIPIPTLPIPTSLPISLPSIPGLPTITIPGLPISIPLGGAPSSSSTDLLGLPLPSLPLPSLPGLGGTPTSTSSGLLGLPLPSLPLPIGGSPTSSSSGLLGLPLPSLPLGLASEAPISSA